MGEYRERSPLWKGTTKNKRSREDYNDGSANESVTEETGSLGFGPIDTVTPGKQRGKEDGYKLKHANRWCYSHEYVGMSGLAPTNHGQETSVLDLFDP